MIAIVCKIDECIVADRYFCCGVVNVNSVIVEVVPIGRWRLERFVNDNTQNAL